uniref:B cell linker n=1 Tax=Lepisosteus oculatus TaxID=7918 RepID=W5MK64_LEPOC
MERLTKITAPAGEKLRQLQKMVQDIKKNDGGIMNKFKKITNKPPPTVPRRDYPDEDDEDEQWSETEFDSDYENADDHSETYEVPLEDNDDSYEPPPCEKEKRNITSVSSLSKGDYADKRTESSRLPPRKPVPSIPRPQQPVSPQKPPKPQLLVKPQKPEQDDADYICPKEDGEDDNYIEPSEKSSVQDPPAVNRDTKPTIKRSPPPGGTHEPTGNPAVCPALFRSSRKYQPPIKKLPAASVQQNANKVNFVKKLPSTVARGSLPRNGPTAAEQVKQKLEMISPKSIQHFLPHNSKMIDNELYIFTQALSLTFQEAGVYSKSWYASTSERKVAEDALMKTNKDGSFLIRKSSGHDAKQPYTLVVFYKKKVYNIPVRYIESSKQYALGREKAGEEWFSSVADMIENHQHNPLVLIDSQNNTKDSTKLKYPVKV